MPPCERAHTPRSPAAPTSSSCPAASGRTGACMETAAAGLRSLGLRVLIPELLPINDGGISYGQAAVAVRRTATNGR